MAEENEKPQPSPNGPNGRATGGKFAAGNKGGPGNPHAARVAKLRSTLLKATTPARMLLVVNKLLELAEGGDLGAIKELFQRTLGPAVELDLLTRLEELETKLGQLTDQRGNQWQR